MKTFIFLLASLSTCLGFAANKLLDYQYGNQITGSVLSIFDDGSIYHTERTCCPPNTDVVVENPLDSVSVAKLIGLISLAATGEQFKYGAGQSVPGSSTGKLTVFESSGNAVNIRTIGFGNLDSSPQPVQKNMSESAREIEKIVFSLVEQKMAL